MERHGGFIINRIKSSKLQERSCSILASLSSSFPIQYRHMLCLYFIDLLHIYFTLALLLISAYIDRLMPAMRKGACPSVFNDTSHKYRDLMAVFLHGKWMLISTQLEEFSSPISNHYLVISNSRCFPLLKIDPHGLFEGVVETLVSCRDN